MAANYVNITTATTVNPSQQQCKLGNVIINTPSGTSGSVKIYDGLTASGTPVASIDSTNSSVRTLIYDVQLKTGLTVVTATGGTPADVTVTWS